MGLNLCELLDESGDILEADNKNDIEQNIENDDPRKQQLDSNSYMDDQFMLEAVETYEKDQVTTSNDPVSIPNQCNTPRQPAVEPMNTTMISQDVLQMCEIFERNVLSSSKKFKTPVPPPPPPPPPPQPSTTSCHKALNFSIGDQTLRDIFNVTSSSSSQLDKQPSISNEKAQIYEFFTNLNLTNLKLNIIDTLTELNVLAEAIKPKMVVSLSLSCAKVASKDPSKDYYVDFYDEERQSQVGVFAVCMCLDLEKCRQIYVILLRRDSRDYLRRLKSLLEMDDLIKIIFFAKSHFKLLYKSLGVVLRAPCYDPLVANWLLTQDAMNIYQIKRKYSATLGIPVEEALKNVKTCYGCGLQRTDGFVDKCGSLKGAIIECTIGIYSFEKIKVQLQLQNAWIYYAKVESEVVLLSARIELTGLGLDLDELNRVKQLLVRQKKDIEQRIGQFAGREINLNSADDVAFVLYTKLRLKPLTESMNSMDKIKHHSTSKDVLVQLAGQHEFPKLIILWRKINHALVKTLNPVERVTHIF